MFSVTVHGRPDYLCCTLCTCGVSGNKMLLSQSVIKVKVTLTHTYTTYVIFVADLGLPFMIVIL